MKYVILTIAFIICMTFAFALGLVHGYGSALLQRPVQPIIYANNFNDMYTKYMLTNCLIENKVYKNALEAK